MASKQLLEPLARSLNQVLDQAGQRLNRFTGYTLVEQMKSLVHHQELLFESSKTQQRLSKQRYEQAVAERAQCQREINHLLQRKHLWSPEDVDRFTELYRGEHLNEQKELEAQREYVRQEEAMERARNTLIEAIRNRYHEEQLWSDKVRSASTYGTWSLVLMNLVLFATVHWVVEPRRRRRLIENIEQLVAKASSSSTLPSQPDQQASSTQVVSLPADVAAAAVEVRPEADPTPFDSRPWKEEEEKPLSQPASLPASYAPSQVRILLVQSFVAGGLTTGLIAWLLGR